LLGVFLLRDVANLALDHALALFLISVAHYLHADGPVRRGLERNIFIANVSVRLQFPKGLLCRFGIFEQADLPQCLADKLLMLVTQQFDQVRIGIGD